MIDSVARAPGWWRLSVLAGCLLWAPPAAAQDTGWTITRMAIEYDIRPSGAVVVREAIDVDFGALERRGIFRDIDDRFAFDETRSRHYDLTLESVTAADGTAWPVQTERAGSATRYRIGNPNRTVTGAQTYRLAYTIGGALNAFDDRDEFYWNATGVWPVPVTSASVTVIAPAGAITRITCYQGARRSTEACASELAADRATFAATRPLGAGEQLTIVVALEKGVVSDVAPRLVASARTLPHFFVQTPEILAFTGLGLVAALGGVGLLGWHVGRDRRYVSMYHLSPDAPDARVPLFGARPLGVEFAPPDKLRPAEVGLLIDERADTLDITATIVDLAVRGYLSIHEIKKAWWFSRQEWRLDKHKPADEALVEYERIVFDGIFGFGDSKHLSELKNKFHTTLSRARTALYQHGVVRGWFPRDPSRVRVSARVLGLVAAGAGVLLVLLLGARWGAGLLGLPVVAFGMALSFVSGVLPRRTAAGRHLFRRALGFEKYIKTAETAQLAYAERMNIFSAYLPYAIAFRAVDKWARAFKDLDLPAATAGWYAGTSRFDAGSFSSRLGSFSSATSSTLASTPGGSGGSGFGGGGSSGGGGGGGGGGSW
ncbi:MAG TPA: DUF2207 domain-containing protein [Vicinamibacterales bacterium]|nr:DUF2207 domain-containing protein [Vicinamibacterales bacterium]